MKVLLSFIIFYLRKCGFTEELSCFYFAQNSFSLCYIILQPLSSFIIYQGKLVSSLQKTRDVGICDDDPSRSILFRVTVHSFSEC